VLKTLQKHNPCHSTIKSRLPEERDFKHNEKKFVEIYLKEINIPKELQNNLSACVSNAESSPHVFLYRHNTSIVPTFVRNVQAVEGLRVTRG
jgi:hypothetical protein